MPNYTTNAGRNHRESQARNGSYKDSSGPLTTVLLVSYCPRLSVSALPGEALPLNMLVINSGEDQLTTRTTHHKGGKCDSQFLMHKLLHRVRQVQLKEKKTTHTYDTESFGSTYGKWQFTFSHTKQTN